MSFTDIRYALQRKSLLSSVAAVRSEGSGVSQSEVRIIEFAWVIIANRMRLAQRRFNSMYCLILSSDLYIKAYKLTGMNKILEMFKKFMFTCSNIYAGLN